MKKILLVNTLPKDDPSVLPVVQALESEDNKVQIINTYEKNFRPCVGCNACWLITPGVCSLSDGYDELLKAYLAYDAVVFLSGTTLNFVDWKMKNIIDRVLPLVTMGIHIVDGQCRHIPRYDKKFRFGLVYSGVADNEYLNYWMERVMLNFGGESLGAYPVSDVKGVSACI
ncbi:MAG: flavodoxin family protein [Oscillospiraceae bacterium]